MKKRIFSTLIAVLCAMNICSVMPLSASEEELTYGDLTYRISYYGDFVIIDNCDTSVTSVEIPSEIDGLPVERIGFAAFRDCTSLRSITIPDSVTDIGDHAFSECTSLTSITVSENNENYSSIDGVLFNKEQTELIKCPTGNKRTEYIIPDSVTSIGYEAFCDCISLTSITIPDSVTSIGSDAFCDTALLNNQTGVKYADKWVVDCDEDIVGAEIKSGTRGIGNAAFFSCESLESITIPDSVTSIGGDAFAYCESLTSITIPNSVTSIGYCAFNSCKSLTSITIPDSVTSIGNSAFIECTSLENITIGNGVTSIEERTFSDCTSLENVIIGNSVTCIGIATFFGCKNLTSITIPDSVTDIGDGAFIECTSLESITIPNSVTRIGESAFYGCYSLESITIPNSVTSIGDGAFWGCDNLTSITIPDSVTSIGNYTFFECTNLESITIGNGVTRISDLALYGCISLESITIENPDCEIDNSEYTIPETAIIYGYEDSTAQTYAETYEREFVSLGRYKEPETEPSTNDSEIRVPDGIVATYLGDANTDGIIDVADIISLNFIILSPDTFSSEQIANSDYYQDGIINTTDSVLLMNYVAMI